MENPSPKLNPQSSGKRQSRWWIVTGGIFVLFLLSIGLYFYWWYFTTDNLIQLAPIDSVLYVQARDSIWPIGQKTKISDLPFRNFYQQIDEEEIFSSIDFKNLLVNSQQVAFILTLDKDSNLDSVFLFKLRDPKSINSVLPDLSHQALLNKNILVVASSNSALNKIKEVAAGSIFSLATQIDLKKLGRSMVGLYLDSDNLKSHLNQRKNLVDKIFAQLINQDIYLVIDKKDKQWQFELMDGSLSQIQNNGLLVEYLPEGFSVFVSGVNLAEIFQSWSAADKDFFDSLQQIKESLKVTYNLDVEKDIIPLLNQPADLIIFNQEVETALGLDYILLLPQFSEEQRVNFEKFVKIVLAQKLPQGVNHFLPDGSMVVELLAQEDIWQWQKEKADDNLEINYLQEPDLNLEIGYLVKGGKMMLASSLELLKDFVLTQDIDLGEFVSRCQTKGSARLILNSDNVSSFFDIYLPDELILVKANNKVVNGCLLSY